MTLCLLASTRPHFEFPLADAINDMGGVAIVPRRVDILDGQPVYRPFLPNYMFLALTEDQWHQFHAARLFWMKPQRNGDPVKTILPEFRKVLDILPRTWGEFQGFAERTEFECMRRIEQFEAGLAVARYRHGDMIRIIGNMLDGQLNGQVAEFLRLDAQGRIIAKVKGMELLGKPITATLDPRDVQGIAAE